MENIHKDQVILSEQLSLLRELGGPGRHIPFHTHDTRIRRNDRDARRDLRLLDTIATVLTTGKPGDVFAAAFDKRCGIELVLAKNGRPNDDDKAAAQELVSLLSNPAVMSVSPFLPFLFRRCYFDVDKRIHHLHDCISSTILRDIFRSALKVYEPDTDIHHEFRNTPAVLHEYDDVPTVPPFTTIWEDLMDKLHTLTAPGLDFTTPQHFLRMTILSHALSHSPFLKALRNHDNPTLLLEHHGQLVEKFKRRLDKINQYGAGIIHLVHAAKRLPLITCRWVMDDFSHSGEGTFYLPDDDPYDVIRNHFDNHDPPLPLPMDAAHKLDTHLSNLRETWASQQTIHAALHAELRLILHLTPTLLQDTRHKELLSPCRPNASAIGVSKRSCLCCTLWIEAHNHLSPTQWMTSGSHGKPYPNWALPGTVHPYLGGVDGRKSAVDKAVLDGVYVRLTDMLDWLIPGKRSRSDESDPEDYPYEYRLRKKVYN